MVIGDSVGVQEGNTVGIYVGIVVGCAVGEILTTTDLPTEIVLGNDTPKFLAFAINDEVNDPLLDAVDSFDVREFSDIFPL